MALGVASVGAPDAQSEELNFFNFFGDILIEDEAERKLAMERISERLKQAAHEAAHEQQTNTSASPPLPLPSELLAAHLPSVLRLALACPLKDITAHMKQLLHDLAAINPAYTKYVSALQTAFQPSSFVPLSSCVDPTGESSHAPVSSSVDGGLSCGETKDLLVDIFLSTGRTSHIDLLMAWHPTFLTQFTNCIHHLMDDNGPLPHTWRNYLAIMAAARHHCQYLISFQETEYILKGGDPTWLQGISHAPKKLQSLCDLNALLAHQPWLITKQHISNLVHNAGTDSWSVAELVHALVILSTFHSLCGFVFGMGLRDEIDGMDWERWEPEKAAHPQPLQRRALNETSALHATPLVQSAISAVPSPISQTATHSTATSISVTDGEQLLRLLSNSNSGSGPDDRSNIGNAFNQAVEEGTSPAHDLPSFRHTPTHTDASATHTAVSSITAAMRGLHVDPNDPSAKYIYLAPDAANPISPASSGTARTVTMKYIPFDVNSKQYSIFFLHDYSWKEHGYALVNRFYQGFAQMLDTEFDGQAETLDNNDSSGICAISYFTRLSLNSFGLAPFFPSYVQKFSNSLTTLSAIKRISIPHHSDERFGKKQQTK